MEREKGREGKRERRRGGERQTEKERERGEEGEKERGRKGKGERGRRGEGERRVNKNDLMCCKTGCLIIQLGLYNSFFHSIFLREKKTGILGRMKGVQVSSRNKNSE